MPLETALAQPRSIPASLHRDIARAITAVENGYANVADAERTYLAPYPEPPHAAYVVGFTGPPGAGKSTLVDCLIERLRAQGKTVAVIAVDPSSPFTKGAVLGDRVRMQRHASDPGVFIRSMASREAGGGLAPTTRLVLALIQRAGFDVILIETVGVGQVELEIVSLADVIAVVTVPALGDGVQTIKAGMMEIADIFIVNMADRPGANATAVDLTHMVRDSRRDVPVLQTIGTSASGIDELIVALDAARDNVTSNAQRAVRFEVIRTVRDGAVARAAEMLDSSRGQRIFQRLSAHEITRVEARAELLAGINEGAQHAD